MNALHQLAARAGLSVHWTDYRGRPQTVPDESLIAVLHALGYDLDRPSHAEEHVRAFEDGGEHCVRVSELAEGRRIWGLAAQVYALRGGGVPGAGNFRCLRLLAQAAAQQGADAVMINPVHAGYAADPNSYSPYAPSSRLFLNALYADPATMFPEFSEGLSYGADADELIQWPRVHRHRYAQLLALWTAFQAELPTDSPRARAFRAWCRAQGTPLEQHARFEALHAREFGRSPQHWDWRGWPQALRSPESEEVEAFAHTQRSAVDFYKFAQWLARLSLNQCQQTARDAGMAIGLIADIAVGTQAGGSQAWSDPESFLQGVTIGAPPDDLNARGQSWGLTAYSPPALRRQGYEPYARMLEASMEGVGGIRIDHVLGLNRLWLVPQGADASQGVYLQYPVDDLLAVTAACSRRRGSLVIGEDLGTVPEGLRGKLARRGLLGLQVLWFQNDGGGYFAPEHWSEHAVAVTSTHDLPTLAGWQASRDLDARTGLGQFTEDEAVEARERRSRESQALRAALRRHGLAPQDVDGMNPALCAYVARSAAPLALFPLEDLCGQVEQTNLPGTVDEHPNWRRRMACKVEDLLDLSPARECLAAIRRERHG